MSILHTFQKKFFHLNHKKPKKPIFLGLTFQNIFSFLFFDISNTPGQKWLGTGGHKLVLLIVIAIIYSNVLDWREAESIKLARDVKALCVLR